MRKILNLFIILVTLLLVGCNNEELPIENVYSINGPSILQVETYDKTVNEIKNEISSNFKIYDQNDNIINIYHIIIDYGDIDFYKTHTYDVVITTNIINNDLSKTFKLIIDYTEDEDEEFTINIILDIENTNHQSLKLTRELLIPHLDVNPIHPNIPDQFVFKYWAFDEAGLNKVEDDFVIDNDYNIFAIWEHLYPHTLFIILDIHEPIVEFYYVGDGIIINPLLSTSIEHPLFPYDYNFSYWALDEDGSEPLPNNFVVNDDLFIYAIWEEKVDTIESIDIFYVNDLHGQLFQTDNSIGLSRIHQFIQDYNQANNTESIIIFGGDIFQGTLVSRNSYGEVLIDAMNLMGVDALVLGNHEFDWELEIVTRYFNPNYDGVTANFPLLSANTFYKNTNDLPPFIDPYTVINKNGLEIGIIGLMGYGLESSIMETKVDQYYFAEPVSITGDTAQYIRSQHNADLIISSIHGGFGYNQTRYSYNNTIANLSGNSLINAVFNAHTHNRYEVMINRSHAYDLPVIQSGSNGNTLGHLKLTVENKKVIEHEIKQYYPYSGEFSTSNSEMDLLLNSYYQEVISSYEDTILTTNTNLYRNDLSSYVARIMRERTNSDVAIHNTGGTRADLNIGNLTHADIFQVFPFDNRVVKTKVLGSELKAYMDRYKTGNAYSYRDNLNANSIQYNTYYDVTVNEYIFANSSNAFLYSDHIAFYEEQDLLIKLTWERLKNLGVTYLDLNHQNVWLDVNNMSAFYYEQTYYN